MPKLISFRDHYSIYDYRNLYAIIGVDPDGRKQLPRSKRTSGASLNVEAVKKRRSAAVSAEVLAAGGR